MQPSPQPVRIVLRCTVAAVCLGGCGGQRGPERVVVSGTVSYHGKPVADGVIWFVPVDGKVTPSAGAAIVDGCYRVDNRSGVPVGTHKVRIDGYRTVPANFAPGMPVSPAAAGGKVRKQYLPDKYNTATSLEITIPSGSRNIDKNFDLTD